MTMTTTVEKPGQATAPKQPASKGKAAAELGQGASREARRLAAAILEVLAGARTPTQAASVTGMSLPRYYILESRALQGLLTACEPRPKGRVRSPANEVTSLRHDNDRLQRELARQQALVRASQRTIGLPPPAPLPTRPGKKTRRRRPVARALSVARRLQLDDTPPVASPIQQPTA